MARVVKELRTYSLQETEPYLTHLADSLARLASSPSDKVSEKAISPKFLDHSAASRRGLSSGWIWLPRRPALALVEFFERTDHAHDRFRGVLGIIDAIERLHPIHPGTGHAESHRLVEFEREIDGRTGGGGGDQLVVIGIALDDRSD